MITTYSKVTAVSVACDNLRCEEYSTYQVPRLIENGEVAAREEFIRTGWRVWTYPQAEAWFCPTHARKLRKETR